MDKLRMCDIELNRIKLKKIGDLLPGSYILYENDKGDSIPLCVYNPRPGWVNFERDKDETPLDKVERKIFELYKIDANIRYDDVVRIEKERVGKYLIFIKISRKVRNGECILF